MKLNQFDKIVIKRISQLLEEVWEPVAWGWMKNRTDDVGMAHQEISYYQGIENILDENRVLTVRQDDDGHGNYLHCVETDYHVAKEAIGLVIPKEEKAVV